MNSERRDSGDGFRREALKSTDSMQRQNSRLSFESDGGISEIKNCAEETWNEKEEAKIGMSSALTAFYSLFLTISALVLELSHVLSEEEEREINAKDMIFGMYMYGTSIMFFIYMYVVLLLDPRWYWTMNMLQSFLKKPESKESSLCSTVITTRKVTHSGTSTGSLFLRFGCVGKRQFGSDFIDVFQENLFVYSIRCHWGNLLLLSGFSVRCRLKLLRVHNHSRSIYHWASSNSTLWYHAPHSCQSVDMDKICTVGRRGNGERDQLSITGHHPIARFGTMHLIAANLWTWIRYVLLEEGAMEKEIREVFHAISNHTESGMDEATLEAFEHRNIDSSCRSVECMLGSVSEVMYAAIVEYSLIAAAVMYIVWKNIGKVHYSSEYVKRKYHIRMDCSNTTTGLFLGLIFLIGTFSSMLIYYGYSILGRDTSAAFAYAITDVVQYILATIGCVMAIYYMKSLAQVDKRDSHMTRDQVGTQTFVIYLATKVKAGTSNKRSQPGKQAITFLLAVNLSLFMMNLLQGQKPALSENIIAGLVGLTGEGQWQPLAFLLFVVHILRLIQVGTQTFVIYLATKVKAGTSNKRSQPGKQAITFLLAVNLSLFMMNLLQGQKPALSENIIGEDSNTFLSLCGVESTALSIFFRFLWRAVMGISCTQLFSSDGLLPISQLGLSCRNMEERLCEQMNRSRSISLPVHYEI
ncbi:hypothetical protein OSTOST_03289, partial [Ostertagia ostertagi]